MYDNRVELMERMIEDLRNYQTVCPVMSDEEFYNSDYGYSRREKGHSASNTIFLHVLIPGSKRNLMTVYFHKKDIAFAPASEFNNTICKESDKRGMTRVAKKNYVEYRTAPERMDSMYDDALALAKELLEIYQELFIE